MSDCFVVMVAGQNCHAVSNYAAVNPAATGTGTIGSGSSTVTTALAAVAVVGQSIVIAGAGGGSGGLSPLVGLVSSINTGAGTITFTQIDGENNLTASAAVAGGTVTLYPRDNNIRVIGGFWNFGANSTGVDATINIKFFFRHLDTYWVDVQGMAATGIGYMVGVADGTAGYGRLRNLNTTTSFSTDGWHVNGPHYKGLVIDQLTGTTHDDAFAITGNNYPLGNDCSGNIVGVTVRDIDVHTANRSFNIIAGVGNLVDDITFHQVRGTSDFSVAACAIGDDTTHALTEGGTYGTIDCGIISTVVTAAIGLLSINGGAPMNKIRARTDYDQGGTFALQHGVQILDGAVASTIHTLELQGSMDVSGTAIASAFLRHSSSLTAVDQVNMTDPYFNGNASGARLVEVQSGSVITELNILNPRMTNPSSNGLLVNVDTGGAGFIGRLNVSGGSTTNVATLVAGPVQYVKTTGGFNFNGIATESTSTTVTEASPVGSPFTGGGSGTKTLAVTPVTVGNVLVFAAWCGTTADRITAVSGGGVTTWNNLAFSNPGSIECELWWGTVTAAGAATITITTASSGFNELIAQEFTVGVAAAWGQDGPGIGQACTITGQTSGLWPALMPSGPGRLYVGALASGGAQTVFTTGFTGINLGGSGIALVYSPNCNFPQVQQPGFSQGSSLPFSVCAGLLVSVP